MLQDRALQVFKAFIDTIVALIDLMLVRTVQPQQFECLESEWRDSRAEIMSDLRSVFQLNNLIINLICRSGTATKRALIRRLKEVA